MTIVSSIVNDIESRDFEEIVLCRDPGAGLRSVIAIHDTTLGPSLGGIRMRRYPTHDDAVRDALDLAQAMTYKAALAGLDLGGGKSVIDADPATADKARIMAAHARYIGALGGRYIPAVDMGTSVADLDVVARHVRVVASERRDPSRFTALGVVRSIEAALRWSGADGLGGHRIAVQGLGHVGRHVVDLLLDAGADVLVADIDDARVRATRNEVGVAAVPADEILLADADVLCPCGPGGVVTEEVADRLKARILVGAANNLLRDDRLAAVLAARGILHVPDFVANAGGLMAAEADVRGSDAGLEDKVEGIARTALEILDIASRTGRDTVGVAHDLASRALESRRERRPTFPAA